MFKILLVQICVVALVQCVPVRNKESVHIRDEDLTMAEKSPVDLAVAKLNLPSNATSIRAEITDSGFTCDNKTYGYYADIENDCQIFHVCLPVVYADGKEGLFRWSFICPEETVFSQDSFTCMRSEDMLISCEESVKYFDLNGNFGMPVEEANNEKEDATKMPMMAEIEEKTTEKPTKYQSHKRKPAVQQTKYEPLRKLPTKAPVAALVQPMKVVVQQTPVIAKIDMVAPPEIPVEDVPSKTLIPVIPVPEDDKVDTEPKKTVVNEDKVLFDDDDLIVTPENDDNVILPNRISEEVTHQNEEKKSDLSVNQETESKIEFAAEQIAPEVVIQDIAQNVAPQKEDVVIPQNDDIVNTQTDDETISQNDDEVISENVDAPHDDDTLVSQSMESLVPETDSVIVPQIEDVEIPHSDSIVVAQNVVVEEPKADEVEEQQHDADVSENTADSIVDSQDVVMEVPKVDEVVVEQQHDEEVNGGSADSVTHSDTPKVDLPENDDVINEESIDNVQQNDDQEPTNTIEEVASNVVKSENIEKEEMKPTNEEIDETISNDKSENIPEQNVDVPMFEDLHKDEFKIPVEIIHDPVYEDEDETPKSDESAPNFPAISIDDIVDLVKESLDIPEKNEKISSEPSAPQESSEDMKPIYNRKPENENSEIITITKADEVPELTHPKEDSVIIPISVKEDTHENVENNKLKTLRSRIIRNYQYNRRHYIR